MYHKMGRLSTAVAAIGVDAGNLPEKLPTISLWDALLPGSWSRKKVGRSPFILTYRRLRLIQIPRIFSAHPHAKNQNTHAKSQIPNPSLSIPQLHSEPSSHPHSKTPSKAKTSIHLPNTIPTRPSHRTLIQQHHRIASTPTHPTTPSSNNMPFFIKPFFRKPFKLFAIDADTGQPLDPNVHRRTRVKYYELAEGSNGSKKLVAHKSPSQITKEGGEAEGKAEAEAEAKPAEGEGSKKEGGGSRKEGSKKEEASKEGSKKEGSKKEDAPKEGSKKEDAPKEGSKKGDEAKVEQKGNDVAWTPEEDEKLKAMKAENKSWKIIAEEMGRAQHVLKARFKEIGGAAGNDQGKKNADGKGQNDKEKQGGGGQGKQGKKGKKGGDNQQNNQKHDNKNNTNEKSNQEKKESEKKPSSSKKEEESNKPTSKPASINKPTSKPASAKPASISNSANAAANETRFTMTDWLTLQEDDMFSFGELQCLSELIGKDLSQSWQRVAAKFFDLTGRRIHPDDVRDKFERMAVMAQGGKGV
jgi:hypothetical protein